MTQRYKLVGDDTKHNRRVTAILGIGHDMQKVIFEFINVTKRGGIEATDKAMKQLGFDPSQYIVTSAICD